MKQGFSPRRRLVLGLLGAGGALACGWAALPPRQRMHAAFSDPAAQSVALNGWVQIAPDGQIIVIVHRTEMGQGIHTGLAMLVAEELEVSLSQVRVQHAPPDPIYANLTAVVDMLPFHPDDDSLSRRLTDWLMLKTAREIGLQLTGGSSGIRDAWQGLREAGAFARSLLVQAAAARWKVAAEACAARDGRVWYQQQSFSYAELAADAAKQQISSVQLKPASAFRLIGKSQQRLDAHAKSHAQTTFGIDVRLPGMLFAAIRMPERFGQQLASMDAAAIRQRPGVQAVVDVSADVGQGGYPGVAVVADSYWQARQAADALPVVWRGGDPNLSSEKIRAQLEQALTPAAAHVYHYKGDARGVLVNPEGRRILKAEYSAPFLAHAAMEPVSFTAHLHDDKLELWGATQVPTVVYQLAQHLTGLPAKNIVLHELPAGGAFGRRLEADMVRQVIAIAKAVKGRPVQLIWNRSDDMQHDMYRPAAIARFHAALNEDGTIAAWENLSASASIAHQFTQRLLGLPGMGPDKSTAEGEYDLCYQISNQQIAHAIVHSDVPVGYWRSVGHSHNAFFKECFIDELAAAAGVAPLEFRLRHLKPGSRHEAVLKRLAETREPAPASQAWGIALHACFGSVVAMAALVSVQAGQIRVHRIRVVADCGLVVNPNLVQQQLESGVVFGLSAALFGEITIEGGKVRQSNFHDYPVMRITDLPQIETVLMPGGDVPQGVGEIAVPPVAPAVANALAVLTGQRLRNLPLRLHSVR